ncbi:Glycosyltransferase involved in cell wall bisynthesis [Zobellia uliginosa]|uniref:Glycosyltransferase involved in cell wall bisynthesis n=1 Tax=Zobellia uliginosa TaxID=143224 RepID=A0ABY1KMY0_9FLAO|nr:glycosyltransferase family 2 protein [Zobellia uliginosa]SIS51263.1 Glycosyltransferase involved in cell wall bisynthesis [Zobellia uliginosa]
MFSILTPTHNRADVIERVYKSLKNQTYKGFEWIIIDDASKDNTEEIVKAWQITEKEFNIRYYKLPHNLGKAAVVNFGIDKCSRPFTIIADDDDTFSSNTLEDLKLIWDTIDKTENSLQIGAVWTLVQDEQGKIIGEKFPSNFWQVNFKQRVLERNGPPKGEKWHSWRTAVLKKYKKFTNPNSRVDPSVSWNRINKHYDFLCVNIVHRTYCISEDGYIQQKKSRLKVEKRHYYSSFLELKHISPFTIIKEPYYRNTAFSYIKSSYFYYDKENSLDTKRFITCLLTFLILLPSRAFKRFFLKV